MLDNKLLIENIKRLCSQHNIKITNLEKELGFGAGIISRWGNDADPSLSKIIQVADYFHVSIDEVVGHNNIINDKFLEKLISQTEDRIIQWNAYEDNDNEPKKYDPTIKTIIEYINSEDYEEYRKNHQHTSFYTKINNGYISIDGYYEYQEILNPKEIKLFIQSDNNAQLVEQDYSYDQLKVLWLKVLKIMGNEAPDEIKTEEFKNNFINTPQNLTNEKIEDFLNDPSLLKLIETVSTDEFQKIRKTFEDPQFKSAMQMVNSLQSYLDHKKIEL